MEVPSDLSAEVPFARRGKRCLGALYRDPRELSRPRVRRRGDGAPAVMEAMDILARTRQDHNWKSQGLPCVANSPPYELVLTGSKVRTSL